MPELFLGLCADCRHHRVVPTARGVIYHRCALAETRPELDRYPRLPMLACASYEPEPAGE
jgi:hypothetical protein